MQAPVPIVILEGPQLIHKLVNPAYQQIFPGGVLLNKTLPEALPELTHTPIPTLQEAGRPAEIAQKGRPRNRPKAVVADKGYDSAHLRRRLRQRGIKAMIPERRLPEGKKRRKKGPHYRFDKDIYKKRAAVEQSIGPTKSVEGLPLVMRNRPLVSWLSSVITLDSIHWTRPRT